jgi:SAM-dependent methyltransferase
VTPPDRPHEVVAAGYDRIVDSYRAWASAIDDPSRTKWLERLTNALPPGARVLELGCGSGSPVAAELSARFELTGVDASAAQIEQARRSVPNGRFIVADMSTVELPAGRWDAVAALYSIIHVPRERHAELFRRIRGWLRPGGWFLASLGARDAPDWTGPWLGVPMFFSTWGASTNLRLLSEAGLEVDDHEVTTLHEPEGDVTFQWVLARRAVE